jgi:hypothetical protein
MINRSNVVGVIVKSIVCAAIAVPTLYVLITTLNTCFSISFPSIYMDQWDNIAAYFMHAEDGHILKWLFSFHNEHQILVPRLLFLADWTWFRGTDTFLIVWILANQAVFAFTFYYILRRASLSTLTNLSVIFVTVIFLYSSSQMENLSWGFQVQFVNVYLFAFLSLLFYCDYLSNRTWWRLILTGVFAVMASFSMSNGVLIWPLLLFVATTHKAWKNVIGFGLLFALILSVYLNGNSVVGEAFSRSNHSWKEAIEFIRFVLVYMGNPLGKTSLVTASGFGLISILYLAFLSGIVFTNRKMMTSGTKTLIFSSLFILGSAFITSLGRLQFGILQATSGRYTTPALVFLSLLLVLTAILLNNRNLKLGFRMILWIWLLIVAVFMGYLIKCQRNYIIHYTNKFIIYEIALSAIQNNAFDPYYFSFLHPRMENHLHTIEHLKKDKVLGKNHNLIVPNKPRIEQIDGSVAEMTQVHLLKIASFAGDKPSYIVYGGLKADRKTKGARLLIADSTHNWTGSGYVTDRFPASWPFTEFQKGDSDLVFIVHLNADIMQSRFALYLERQHELLKIGDLTKENLQELEECKFIHLDEYSGVIPDYQIVSKDPAWTKDGIYPAAPRPEKIATHYGSWKNGGDAATGELHLSIANLAGFTQLDVPYISGPMIPNGSVILINRATKEVIRRVRPVASSDGWVIIRFNLPKGLESIDLVILDEGDGWGQWMGIGEPSLH